MWTTTLRLYLSEKRETEKRQSAAEEQNQIDFDSPLTHQKNEKKQNNIDCKKIKLRIRWFSGDYNFVI